MRLTRETVLDGAFAILDSYGLGDLTMRRLASSLGIQPGGLYWHFADKQTLLAAMADAIVAEVAVADEAAYVGGGTDWRTELRSLAHGFRWGLLGHRDGAELVATGQALHPGSGEPLESMIKIIERAGLEPERAHAAASALTHYVLGHTAEVQAHARLRAAGAIAAQDPTPDADTAFDLGIEIFLDGLAGRLG